jgi:hypothetical protein
MLSSKYLKLRKISVLALGAMFISPTAVKMVRNEFNHKTPKRSALQTLALFTSQFGGTSVRANGPGYTQSVTNLIRQGVGMVVGFSDNGYLTFVCNGDAATAATGDCDGPPQSGIVGAIAEVANLMQTAAQSGGITSCLAVPTSGTVTGTDSSGASWTLTFSTPTHTIPPNWTGGGTTFDRRVTASPSMTLGGQTQALKLAMEFNCSSSDVYAAIDMPVSNPGNLPGENAQGYTRAINVYTGVVNSTTNGFDVYFAEELPTGVTVGDVTGPLIRNTEALKIEYQPAASTFNLWMAVGGANFDIQKISGGGANELYLNGHAIVSGNYSTGQASLYFNGLEAPLLTTGTNEKDIDIATMDSDNPTVAADDTLATSANFGLAAELGTAMFSGSQVQLQGCVTFETPDVAPTSAALCPGMTLVAASSAPAIDSTGKFSADWAAKTMVSKMEVP